MKKIEISFPVEPISDYKLVPSVYLSHEQCFCFDGVYSTALINWSMPPDDTSVKSQFKRVEGWPVKKTQN